MSGWSAGGDDAGGGAWGANAAEAPSGGGWGSGPAVDKWGSQDARSKCSFILYCPILCALQASFNSTRYLFTLRLPALTVVL
jgi:hypothetical protein